MAWVTPKINWQPADYINYTDLNRIKNNVQELKDSMFVGTSFGVKVIPERREYFVFNISDQNKDYYYQLNVTIRGNTSGQTYRYTYYFHGAGEHRYGEECPVVGAEECRSSEMYSYYRGSYPFTIMPMFEDKVVNDLWYADEFNTVINNLDKIAEACGVDFIGKPYYYTNGATPTAEELNTIERTTRNLYNLINNPYRIYLGIGGYVGGRLTNALL